MGKRGFFLLGVVFSLGSVAALLAAAGFVQDYYPPAKEKVLSIPAAAFQVLDKDVDFSNTGGVLFLKSGSAQYIRAPLILPHNAKLIRVELVALDENDGADIRLWVHAVDNAQQESRWILYAQSEEAVEGEWRSFGTREMRERIIDNEGNCYFLNLHLPGTGADGYKFSHAKVYYSGKW